MKTKETTYGRVEARLSNSEKGEGNIERKRIKGEREMEEEKSK